MSNPHLNNIRLRALEPEDLNFLYSIENDEQLWEVSNTQKPYSKHILQQYIDNSHLDIYEAKQIRFVIENENNEVVGLVDLFDFNPQHLRAGVGIVISNKHQKKGYASETLKKIHQYAFTHLNIKQLYANITVDNAASIKLFESHHYQLIGIKKDWILHNSIFKDVALYQFIQP